MLIVMQSEGESVTWLLLMPLMDQFGVTHNSESTHKTFYKNYSSHHSSMLVLWKEHLLHGCQVGQDLCAQFLTCSQFWYFYCGCSRFLLLQLLCQWLNVIRVKSALL